ncbi:MAG TPA: hypothetical protein VN520_36670, partial [Streptomyces sp.]|uniref:hypothetical protein n=1 Tax=Streptomyces sp. TaxID=1931 RepID=UPI002BC9D0D2
MTVVDDRIEMADTSDERTLETSGFPRDWTCACPPPRPGRRAGACPPALRPPWPAARAGLCARAGGPG